MPRRARPLCLVLVLAAAGLAGCTDDAALDPFPGAELHFDGSGDGTETHAFTLPEDAHAFQIGVHYRLDSGDAVVLAVYHGENLTEFGSLENHGPADERDPAWVQVRNNTVQEWVVRVTLREGGAYRIGVSWTDDATP